MELEEKSFDFACGDSIPTFPYGILESKTCSNKVYYMTHIIRAISLIWIYSVLSEISTHLDLEDVNTFNKHSINGVVVVVRTVIVPWNVAQTWSDVWIYSYNMSRIYVLLSLFKLSAVPREREGRDFMCLT